MSVSINTTSGYYYLDSWILASVLHLGTVDFCKRFINNANDPGGRQYAQMTQAARSCPANVAEGSSRRDTSMETMMKLTDVARATISELAYDYLSLLLSAGALPWTIDAPDYLRVHSIRLPRPIYSKNFLHDVGAHILNCKNLFAPWLDSADMVTAANAMLVVCGRINSMITAQLDRNLADFKVKGGFTENLTQSRLETRQQQLREESAPECPRCGKPMRKQWVKRGAKQGSEFWGCSDFPNCRGTRPI